MDTNSDASPPFDPTQIKRPDPALFRYYFFLSLISGPAMPIAFVVQWVRYATLRYSIDEDGISMSWGYFFRREVYLTYRRIQDIHVTHNILQRWMGLSNVSVQTASGSATPEMVIEGILQAEQLRDFLYTKMRGARDGNEPRRTNERLESKAVTGMGSTASHPSFDAGETSDSSAEALLLLKSIRDNMQTLVRNQESAS
jgi:uncharacterized protein